MVQQEYERFMKHDGDDELVTGWGFPNVLFVDVGIHLVSLLGDSSSSSSKSYYIL
jgi:hypothetical protein